MLVSRPELKMTKALTVFFQLGQEQGRYRPGPLLQFVQHPPPYFLVQDQQAGGSQVQAGEFLLGTLGFQIYAAQRFHLDVKELDAAGFHPRREHVKDVAAPAKLPGGFYPLHPLITQFRQTSAQFFYNRGIPGGQFQRPLPDMLWGRQQLQQGRGGGGNQTWPGSCGH
jgi:hypothetical protein